MRALTAPELLSVWEQGQAQPHVHQALQLLGAASPDLAPEALARLSIGQRDARLLTLREWTFGPQLVGLARCPRCDERLELTLALADIRAEPEPQPQEAYTCSAADYVVRWRLPNSLDLLTVSGSLDTAEAHRRLLERCVLEARQAGEERSAAQVPPEVVEAMVRQMAEADPQANVQLSLTCPACGDAWQAPFDIVSFFWSEIDAWARRTLREVHALALAYGWTERDTLALSPQRRQLYLEMATG